jgi:octaprenyl-diphosphate synthase
MKPLSNTSNSDVVKDYNSDQFLFFFEGYISDLLDSFEPNVKDMARDVVLGGGKRIRPFLVYTCGASNLEATESLLKASAVIEIVHVATLVHDDILDNALLRRGKPTLHSKYGDHTSILLGDALFSFALELATDFPDSTVCRKVSRATRKTCSGEINQTFSKGNFDITAEDYFTIIQNKTGELFSASCSTGAYLAGLSPNLVDLVGDFGTSLGLNYQIYDDLVDTFGNNLEFGKTLGTDLNTGKITLPIIRLLEALPSSESKSIKSILASGDFDKTFKSHLGELFIENQIHEICFSELSDRFSNSKLIASNIPDKSLSSRLSSFLSSFDNKLMNLSSNLLPNFLAMN